VQETRAAGTQACVATIVAGAEEQKEVPQ
jgi:hypothetical protein